MIDLFLKIKNKIRDNFTVYCWYKYVLGHLGKNSYIKPGVKLIGNSRRIKIGNGFKIWHNSILSVSKNGEINIGDNGLIAVGSFLSAGSNKIIIGKGVAIAPHCNIIAYSHHYAYNKQFINCYEKGDIVIGDNVLIGAAVTILPNVTIGNNCVIAAGCVVNSNVPDNTVVGGIPMKIIKRITNYIAD